MSEDFSQSLKFLADLSFKNCKQCGTPTDSKLLKQDLCPNCHKKKSKKKVKAPPKPRKKRTPSPEVTAVITKQQAVIDKLNAENSELKGQIEELLMRIQRIESKQPSYTPDFTSSHETGIDQRGILGVKEHILTRPVEEKIVIAFYDYQKKTQMLYQMNQVTDQILLKMVLMVETFLNSVEQLQALLIISDNFLKDGTETIINDVSEYIRDSAVSFKRTFFSLSNEKIRKLGQRTLHCEILEETYDDKFTPSYRPTKLGKRFFEIKNEYFKKSHVLNRIKSISGRKKVEGKGKKLYKVIYDHFIDNNKPVTRQELFQHYNLGKYEIDNFKHNLIEVGLIRKVPLPSIDRYHQEYQVPRYAIALQPRFSDFEPKELTQILKGT
ncbi:MAG: hypothetical protein JSV04_12565 [Candidatus Heimdallarchaeota archaeon]|nr:MAG: hypothetical protein JSV04_12565 [Candidatus Heimdallarchaeota archaeon]